MAKVEAANHASNAQVIVAAGFQPDVVFQIQLRPCADFKVMPLQAEEIQHHIEGSPLPFLQFRAISKSIAGQIIQPGSEGIKAAGFRNGKQPLNIIVRVLKPEMGKLPDCFNCPALVISGLTEIEIDQWMLVVSAHAIMGPGRQGANFCLMTGLGDPESGLDPKNAQAAFQHWGVNRPGYCGGPLV